MNTITSPRLVDIRLKKVFPNLSNPKVFIDHYLEDEFISQSYSNNGEAKIVVDIFKRIIESRISFKKVGIITFYTG